LSTEQRNKKKAGQKRQASRRRKRRKEHAHMVLASDADGPARRNLSSLGTQGERKRKEENAQWVSSWSFFTSAAETSTSV